MRLYNYLFYKLYKEAIYIRKGGFPEKRAIMSLTLLLVSNFYFLLQTSGNYKYPVWVHLKNIFPLAY